MTRTGLRRGLCAVALAAGALAVPLAMAGPAFATTGDWGFTGPGGSTPPGNKPAGGSGMQCVGGPCSYDKTMNFKIQLSNGALFDAGAVGTTSDFFSSGTPIGTCTVKSTTKIVCGVAATTGTVGTGTVLQDLAVPTWTIPNSTPDGAVVFKAFWVDAAGQTGNNASNDTYTVTVTNPVGTPLAEPAIAAGGFAFLGALALGFVFLRRRRNAATV